MEQCGYRIENGKVIFELVASIELIQDLKSIMGLDPHLELRNILVTEFKHLYDKYLNEHMGY